VAHDHQTAAEALATARREGLDARLPADLAPGDLDDAYATHLALLDLLGEDGGGARIGWKVGFTNAAAQAKNGADEPVWAGLLAGRSYVDEAEVAAARGDRLGVEAELAVRLGADLRGDVSREEAAEAVEAVALALELVENRGGVDEIGLPTLVADGTLQYGSVFGAWRADVDPRALDQVDVKIQVDGETNGFMRASEVLGHPLNALVWLAGAAERYGFELAAGDVVLLGAIVPAQQLVPGQIAELASDGFGDVRVYVD
jgi:2-keto-4-pentenoate hydratase